MRQDGRVPRKRAKVSETTERADREAREKLKHADLGLFDRFMKKLVKVTPKSQLFRQKKTREQGAQ